MNRREFLSALALPSLCAGCGENALGNNIIALVRGQVGPPTPKVTRDYAAKLPYASMSARLGDKDAALLVLARAQNRDLLWRAGRDIVIVTRAGRIIQTAGLPANLRQTWVRGEDPLAGRPNLLRGPLEYLRVIDLEGKDGSLATVNLRCRLSVQGRQTIAIYGLNFDTIALVEQNDDPASDWQFTNRFWVDAESGFTWKTVQALAPKIPPLSTEVLKPAQQEIELGRSLPA